MKSMNNPFGLAIAVVFGIVYVIALIIMGIVWCIKGVISYVKEPNG